MKKTSWLPDRFNLLIAGGAALASLSAFGAPREAEIVLSGSGPYYELVVPVGAYPDALRPDLAELRILNGRGETVPHAWSHIPETVVETRRTDAPVFAIPAPTKPGVAEPGLVLQRWTDGSLVLAAPAPQGNGVASQWIVDASHIDGALLQLHVRLKAGSEGIFPVIVEVGDDLRHWRLAAEESLVRISRQGTSIEKMDIALGGTRAKYLRLRWRDLPVSAVIQSVVVDSVRQERTAPARQWSANIPAQGCGKDFCDYPLPVGTPVEGLRLSLAETNVLGEVQIIALRSAATDERQTYRRHNPLYVLRQKRGEAPAAARQIPLGGFVAYRLQIPAGEVLSAEQPLDGGIYSALRLRVPESMAALGRTPPAISVATTPRRLVFLARGDGPFRLVWGKKATEGGAVALSTLVPSLPQGQTFSFGTAEARIAPAPVRSAPPVAAALPDAQRKTWLWTALALGLALLGGMAWSLFRSLGTREKQ